VTGDSPGPDIENGERPDDPRNLRVARDPDK
jgi:hypothetical protein